MAEREVIAANEAKFDRLTTEEIWRKMDEMCNEPMSALHPDFDKPNSYWRE